MNANVTNLRKALKACAEAHKVEFHWYKEDGQMALKGETVPVISDVRMICQSFFGQDTMVVCSCGFTNVVLGSDFADKVDETLLRLALPHGTKL